MTTTPGRVSPPSSAAPSGVINPHALTPDTFLGRRITPLTRRRIDNFRANRRAYWSLWIFLVFFVTSLFAEFIANNRPLLIRYDGSFYLPILHDYSERTFG